MAIAARLLRGLIVVALAGGAMLPTGAPPAAAAAQPTISALTMSGSPFALDFDPLPTRVAIELTLSRRARTKIVVLRPDGSVVRKLAARLRLGPGSHVFWWAGRDANGTIAPDGEYRIRVTTRNGAGTERQVRHVRKGLPAIYPANPAAIVVVVDPGHGGVYPGAVRDGWKEKDFNLDIGLKLRALLERAGVQVVMTRTTDTAVNEPPLDWNGDGTINRYDDDLRRNDAANLARGDVAVHVHNNAATNPERHGTAIYINADRSWAPLARTVAGVLLEEEMAALQPYRSPAFTPHNGGVQSGWYYYLAPYDPPFLPRPALITGVLSESLFVSNAADLEALKRADVRTSLAAAIYLGLARWLNTRELGIGYQLLSGPPSTVATGASIEYRLAVTNRGNASSAGWTLALGRVPLAPLYDGSGSTGTPIGSAAVPDGVAPGQTVMLDVIAAAPADAGEWLVKADVRLSDGTYASASGVAPLQVPLTTTAP